MNKAIISGNMCKDLEVTYTKTNNVKVGKFTLAVRRDKDNTDFIHCVAYGKTVELMEKYCYEKGKKIGVVGRIETGNYIDKDSKKVYTTDVIVEEVDFAESKKETPAEVPTESQVTDEDLPF